MPRPRLLIRVFEHTGNDDSQTTAFNKYIKEMESSGWELREIPKCSFAEKENKDYYLMMIVLFERI